MRVYGTVELMPHLTYPCCIRLPQGVIAAVTALLKMRTRIFSGKKGIRILMIGLDAAGKTTILYKLKLGEVVTTIPTIGFNVETVEYKNVSHMLGRGRQIQNWLLWRHYFQGTSALIYVIDSNDRDRISYAKEELNRLLAEMSKKCRSIHVNKQDLPNAMDATEIAERLGLHHLRVDWYIQAACATNGDGIYEGLDWLSTACTPDSK